MSQSALLFSISCLTELVSSFCSNQLKHCTSPLKIWQQPERGYKTKVSTQGGLRFTPDELIARSQLHQLLSNPENELVNRIIYKKILLSNGIWALNALELIDWLKRHTYWGCSNALHSVVHEGYMRIKVNLISRDKNSLFTLYLLAPNVLLLYPPSCPQESNPTHPPPAS